MPCKIHRGSVRVLSKATILPVLPLGTDGLMADIFVASLVLLAHLALLYFNLTLKCQEDLSFHETL